MRRIINVVLVGLFVVSLTGSALAMDARKGVLSGIPGAFGGGYHEMLPQGIVVDSADALLNPTFMLDYGNFMCIDDLGGVSFSGYAFFKLDDLGLPGMLGVQYGKYYGSYRPDIWGGTAAADHSLTEIEAGDFLGGFGFANLNVGVDGVVPNNLDNVRSVGIYYAMPMGDTLKIGFGVNYVGSGVSGKRISDPDSASTEKDDDVTKSISLMMFRAGIQTNLMDKIKLAADVGFGMPNYKHEYVLATGSTATGELATFSGTDIDANIRAAYTLKDNMDLVANVTYFNYSGELEADPDTDAAATLDKDWMKRGTSGWSLFVGPLWHGKDYNYGLQLGVLASGDQEEYTDDSVAGQDYTKFNPSVTHLPVLRGFAEKALAKWFKIMGAITYGSYTATITRNSTLDPLTVDYTAKASEATAYIIPGLGFTVDFMNNWIIQAYMTDTIFLNGPFILTGQALGAAMNYGVSFGFKW